MSPQLPLSPTGVARVCIVGGGGFIGSHFADRFLAADDHRELRIFDNFSSGREWHVHGHRSDPRLTIVRGEVSDTETLTETFRGMDTIIHLASNPDVALAASEPAVDFERGTLLTHYVLEAMRASGARQIVYASGSGVYGDLGDAEPDEDYGPLIPISTYGASKLAGEALIASYCFMFGFRGLAFRFGNVVGSRQTHGVGFDFVRKLVADPSELHIMGDGSQSKSYIAVSDVVDAVLVALSRAPHPYAVFNVATDDYVTVKEVAELAVDVVGVKPAPNFVFTGGHRGWKGDVPVVRLDTRRIRALGWSNQMSSMEALRKSLRSMADDARQGRFD